MNLPLFISKRIAKSEKGAFSSTIHKIAVISISLSLAALIISFFVLFGFKSAIKQKVYDLTGHLVVDKYALSNSYEETPISATDTLLNFISGVDQVEHVQEFIVKAALMKTDEGIQGIVIKGVGERYDADRFNEHLVNGRLPDFINETLEVTVSQKLASLMRISIGDKVTILFAQDPPRFRRVEVVGVYSTGIQEFDDNIVIGHMDLLRKLNSWQKPQVSGLEVFLSDDAFIDSKEMELFDKLDVNLNVTSAQRLQPQIFEWLQLLNRNVLILLIIIMVVAALGMISMVLILIMERTKMIGILKALGGNNQLMRRVFVFQGLRLILSGILFGNLFGLGLCALQHYFKIIPLDQASYYVSSVPIEFDWITLSGLNILMIVMVGLTLFIPVQIVSGIQPLKAIRFD